MEATTVVTLRRGSSMAREFTFGPMPLNTWEAGSETRCLGKVASNGLTGEHLLGSLRQVSCKGMENIHGKMVAGTRETI